MSLRQREQLGERVLARAATADSGALAGTREALYLLGPGAPVRIPWEQIHTADWDRDTEVLTVVEVGSWGEQRPEHSRTVVDPGRLLDLVRERITASVLVHRWVPCGRRGLHLIARRPPAGAGPVTWWYDVPVGVDLSDPAVRAAAERALVEARAELGEC